MRLEGRFDGVFLQEETDSPEYQYYDQWITGVNFAFLSIAIATLSEMQDEAIRSLKHESSNDSTVRE